MKLRKCSCGYTMREECGTCGPTRTAHPPKFSSSDRYGKYRRLARKRQE